MSVQASVLVGLSNCWGKKLSAIEILEVLISAGWSFNDHGEISYLPLGDKGSFDWQGSNDLSIEALYEIIMQKERDNEIVGVVITWQNTLIGGSFLFSIDGNLSLVLSINRQVLDLDGCKITDFQWYLEKLLPPLNQVFGVEYVACKHHI